MMTILFGTMLLSSVPSHMPMVQQATLLREPSSGQALLPNAPVFFLPKSSALSSLAMDVVTRAARKVAPGTIAIVRANYDQEAGETAETALLRADAVRQELIRDGVPSSVIRTVISDAGGTGIETRYAVVSVIRAKAVAPLAATS
jgi:hypothetical protein